MRMVHVPGLHKKTGVWAYCAGVLRPRVVFDALCETQPGGNALIMHELTHAHERHALMGIIIGVLSCGTLYQWFRRWAEIRADTVAARCGEAEFRAFVYMHPHPTSRIGKYRYGATPEERFNRVWRTR